MFAALTTSALWLAALLNVHAADTGSRATRPPATLSWHRVPALVLKTVPPGAPDSVITVQVRNDRRIVVMYTFNNPCDDRVVARVRQTRDTVAVRFTHVSRTPVSLRTGVVSACPAVIQYETDAVEVGPIGPDTVVVRSAVGRGSAWVDLPQRTASAPPS